MMNMLLYYGTHFGALKYLRKDSRTYALHGTGPARFHFLAPQAKPSTLCFSQVSFACFSGRITVKHNDERPVIHTICSQLTNV